jgi:winged helix DNA-binding protein
VTRLLNQQLVRPRFAAPGDLVRWFGAVQAQDYLGSLWAVGQRLKGATEPDVEAAISARSIVRTWPMRGTLHFVPAEDARWMLRLLTPRMIARSASRYRELELDQAAFTRARRVLVRALEGGGRLARPDAYAALQRGGVSPEGQRGIHILGHLAQQQVLCFGPRQGRQPTFVLLDEWVPRAKDLLREEALATLAVRYFSSHGPATRQDFAWWTGLPVREAQAAIDAAGADVRQSERDGRAWWSGRRTPAAGKARGSVVVLLPPWDEYVVAYKDRAEAMGHLRGDEGGVGMAIGKSLVVIDGRVRGSWGRELTATGVRLRFEFWTPLRAAEHAAALREAGRYARFLGKTLL